MLQRVGMVCGVLVFLFIFSTFAQNAYAEDPSELQPYSRKSTTWHCGKLQKDIPALVKHQWITANIWHNHDDVIKSLVTHGADLNFVAQDDWPFLYYAVWNNNKDLVEFLVTHGVNKLDVKDKRSWAVLHYAAYRGYKEIVEYLVTYGADINIKGRMGDAMALAKEGGHTEIVEPLRKHGGKE
jgi:ankyrin repeat protein